MLKITRRRARLTAVIGMMAAASLAFAAPASASPGLHNTAEGIIAQGAIEAGPFAASNFPDGPFEDTLVDATVPGLVSSKTITTEAGDRNARASVEDLSVTLDDGVVLTASAVSSQCAYDPETQSLTGSSSIADGSVAIAGLPAPITLSATPAPNTTVAGIPGLIEVVLNRQVTNEDGSLTVQAIYVNLGEGEQVIIVAQSTCQPQVLIIPVIAPPFAIGAGVLGMLVLGFVLYRRRQTTAGVPAA